MDSDIIRVRQKGEGIYIQGGYKMSDNELLLAISNMIDPIREDVQEIKSRVRSIENRVEKIENRVERIENRVENIENRVERIENRVERIENRVERIENRTESIENRVKKMEIVQENEILPRLNTIESCYTSTYDRYKDSVDGYGTMKQDITIIKKVVAEHSEKLQKIG